MANFIDNSAIAPASLNINDIAEDNGYSNINAFALGELLLNDFVLISERLTTIDGDLTGSALIFTDGTFATWSVNDNKNRNLYRAHILYRSHVTYRGGVSITGFTDSSSTGASFTKNSE